MYGLAYSRRLALCLAHHRRLGLGERSLSAHRLGACGLGSPQSRRRTRQLRKEGKVEKLRKDEGEEKLLLLAPVQEEVRG